VSATVLSKGEKYALKVTSALDTFQETEPINSIVRAQVLAADNINVGVFWDVKLCFQYIWRNLKGGN
jgi:hypothetical protein